MSERYRMYKGPRIQCEDCVEVRSARAPSTKLRAANKATVLADGRPVCWEHYNKTVLDR